MTAKEAMRIIEQRHLTAPEAYEVVHALFDAERREAIAVCMAEERLAKNEEAAQKLAASESLNVYFRDAIGECHLMISRKTSEYQVRKEWECTDLPHRLQTVMKRIEELELALSAETSGLLKRAERAESDVEKLKMDAEHLQYERDEARKNLAAEERSAILRIIDKWYIGTAPFSMMYLGNPSPPPPMR